MLSEYLVKIVTTSPSFATLKQHVTSFPPGFTNKYLLRLLSFDTSAGQFLHCFSSKHSLDDLQNKTSAPEEKNSFANPREFEPKLSHVDNQGHVQMVDIGAKKDSNSGAIDSQWQHRRFI